MEENENFLGALLERAGEYSKTTIELVKLKTLDKTSGAVASIVSRLIAVIFLFMFFLMGSIGLSLWLGDILGKSWYGFFVVAAFYGITGFVLYFFMHNPLKKLVGNFIIKQVLN